jgi:glycosyltransferase involved in cell wall biosynthesis
MRLSVITPTRNAARWLPECLDSVRSQRSDADCIEHLVLDGESADASVEIARRFDARVIEMQHTGVFTKINVGNESATGDVIGYLAGDDVFLPGAVQAVRLWFERGKSPWFVGGARWMDADGRPRGDLIPPPAWMAARMHASLGWNCIFIDSVFFRRDFLRDLGGYDGSYLNNGDYEFHARALSRSPYDRTVRCLSGWRMHERNMSRSGNPVIREELARIQNAYAPRPRAVRQTYRLLLKVWLNGRSPKWFLHKRLSALQRPDSQADPGPQHDWNPTANLVERDG